MKRAIITSPALAPAALTELKDWLGITVASEDAALTIQLRAALESCEAFTGIMPLESECEEVLPVCGDWMRLEASPVSAITGVQAIPAQGPRTALAVTDYALDFAADGSGRVRVFNPGLAQRIAVRFTAGLAASWSALPDGMRHGVIRLAAQQYRQREGDNASQLPPAAVAALWRPWRRMRLT
ncbi:MAG: hypothetical protein ABI673_03290 [Novosphingobium sp.]